MSVLAIAVIQGFGSAAATLCGEGYTYRREVTVSELEHLCGLLVELLVASSSSRGGGGP